jgi:hypothetical protein
LASLEQQHKESPSSVRQLQDAGKVVVGAAGTVAVDRVRAEVDARSSRIAVELKAFANALRASASSLREQGHGRESDMADQLAGRTDRLAAHLATATTNELVEDVKQLSREAVAFARREPALVVAGAFTIGLLIPKALDAIGTRRAADESPRSERTSTARDKTSPPMEQAAAVEDIAVTTELEEEA